MNYENRWNIENTSKELIAKAYICNYVINKSIRIN